MKPLLLALLAWPCLTLAQSYPAKPVRIIADKLGKLIRDSNIKLE